MFARRFVQGSETYDGRSSKVSSVSRFIRLHDRKPPLVRSEVARDERFSFIQSLERDLRDDRDGETSRGRETFLRRSNDLQRCKSARNRRAGNAKLTTSIPQSSIRISSDATLQTPSSTTSVSGLTRRTRSPIALASERTPVAEFNPEGQRCRSPS